MQANYDKCLKHILKFEGGFVNHPKDPGGMTNLGVTKATYEGWLGRKVTEAEMRALTPKSVGPIYKKNYWDRANADNMPSGIDLVVFDFGVNAGPIRAIKFIQELVGVEPDNKVGPMTLAAINEYVSRHGAEKLITLYQNKRKEYYQRLPTFKTFGKGWINRVDACTKAAKELATPKG